MPGRAGPERLPPRLWTGPPRCQQDQGGSGPTAIPAAPLCYRTERTGGAPPVRRDNVQGVSLSIAAVLEDQHDAPAQLGGAGDRQRRRPEPASGAGGSPRALRTVLIAEDEPGLRETLGEIFRLEGYETMEAEDGETALQVLTGGNVDVLLLDLHMPRIDGVSLLHRIDPPPPVVIICSAFEFYDPTEVRQVVGSKVFRMLRKPIPPRELLSAVADAITGLETLEE